MTPHQHLTYQHHDPCLHAELVFHTEGSAWLLSYYRSGVPVGSALYQSRATAELLLGSLGYLVIDPHLSAS